MKKRMVASLTVLGLAFCFSASASLVRDFEDVSQLDDWALDTETVGWVDKIHTADNGGMTMRLAGGGGTSGGNLWYVWDLGQDYDFYQGGSGTISFQTASWNASTTQDLRVQLRDSSNAAKAWWWDGSLSGTFETSTEGSLAGGAWSDATAIRYVYFAVYRNATTSTASGLMDNFNATATVVPEPATFGLLGLVGAGLLWTRRLFVI